MHDKYEQKTQRENLSRNKRACFFPFHGICVLGIHESQRERGKPAGLSRNRRDFNSGFAVSRNHDKRGGGSGNLLPDAPEDRGERTEDREEGGLPQEEHGTGVEIPGRG